MSPWRVQLVKINGGEGSKCDITVISITLRELKVHASRLARKDNTFIDSQYSFRFQIIIFVI